MIARRGTLALFGALACLTASAGWTPREEGPAAPPLTLLYQNFPNPFPTPTSATTCLWFDLESESNVTLAVYDLRGRLVRTIVPSGDVSSRLPAGYYGRNGTGPAATGCDPRFAWDGRGSDGHTVPPGVYLARLRANDSWQTRKMVFRGP